LIAALDEHREWLGSSGEGARRKAARPVERVRIIVSVRILSILHKELVSEKVRELALGRGGVDSAVSYVLERVTQILKSGA
jgi:hypothetical protein